MADRIRTVMSSGGDYSSLSAWEAGEQADLVSLDERRIAECHAFSDTTAVIVASWTADATRYPMVTVPTGQRHDGKWNTSAYRLEVSGATALDVRVTHFRIEFAQISVREDGGTQRMGIYTSVAGVVDCRIDACLVRQHPSSSGSGNIRGIRNGSTGAMVVTNTIVYDIQQNSGQGFARSDGSMYLYNCGAHNCATGYGAGSAGTVRAKNCWAQNCTDGFNGIFHSDCTHNVSDLASDVPGSNGQNSVSIVFVDEAGDDFHLGASDTIAKDAGTSLAADADYPFSGDIDGQTRSGTWDIGPDEYQSGGGGGGSAVAALAYYRKLLGG